MASEIRTKFDASATLTITLASLANSSARQGDMISNTNARGAAVVYVKLSSGASAPTAGATYEIYLIRKSNDGTPIADDNAGASDAAITIENAPILGTIVVTATTNKAFYGTFDTAPLGVLGPNFTFAIRNASGQALNTTAGNHQVTYNLYVPESQ